MDLRTEKPSDEDESVARFLQALAHPVRLALLRVLTQPRLISDIRVAPRPSDASRLAADRALSRQAVREHLDRLLDGDLVSALPPAGAGRERESYVVNHAMLFALAESMRELANLRPRAEWTALQTRESLERPAHARTSAGAALVLVKGLNEGRTFPLEGEGPWLVGRRADAHVALDYDPYVSGVHARIERGADRFVIVDGENRNGTMVNWEPLARGARAQVLDGDLIGVGRTLLLLREARTR